MRLYLLRHGPAEDHAASGRDTDRRLSEPGRALVRAVGAALLRERGAPMPRVVSSPRLRARETAELVREALGPTSGPVEIDAALGGEQAIPEALVTAIVEAGADTLVVGHQPSIEELTRALIRPEPLVLRGFHTATIVTLVARGASFAVASVLDPKSVRP